MNIWATQSQNIYMIQTIKGTFCHVLVSFKGSGKFCWVDLYCFSSLFCVYFSELHFFFCVKNLSFKGSLHPQLYLLILTCVLLCQASKQYWKAVAEMGRKDNLQSLVHDFPITWYHIVSVFVSVNTTQSCWKQKTSSYRWKWTHLRHFIIDSVLDGNLIIIFKWPFKKHLCYAAYL